MKNQIQENFSNIIGKKFGKWEILSVEWHRNKKQRFKNCLCRCECGTEKYITLTKLIHGATKRCRKCTRTDLTGNTIPKNIRKSGTSGGFIIYKCLGRKNGHFQYECICTTCGNIKPKFASRISTKAIACRCHGYINSVKNNAEIRGLKFDLNPKEVWNILKKQNYKCALSGKEIYFKTNKNKTASLDRIDSYKDYTIDNIQWVHKDINLIKMHFDQNYFIELCKMVSENNDNKRT